MSHCKRDKPTVHFSKANGDVVQVKALLYVTLPSEWYHVQFITIPALQNFPQKITSHTLFGRQWVCLDVPWLEPANHRPTLYACVFFFPQSPAEGGAVPTDQLAQELENIVIKHRLGSVSCPNTRQTRAGQLGWGTGVRAGEVRAWRELMVN